jgi:hypothetical protein
MDTIDFLPCGHSTYPQLSVLTVRGAPAYAEVSCHTSPHFPHMTCSCRLRGIIKSRNDLACSPKRIESTHGSSIISILADHRLKDCMDRNFEKYQVLARLFVKHFRAPFETGNQQQMIISTLQSTSSKIFWNKHDLNWLLESVPLSRIPQPYSSRIPHASQSAGFRKTSPAWIPSNTRSKSKAPHLHLR